MSVVCAKFFCSKVTPAELGGASQVQLGAVCRGVENAIWSQATPAGSIQMSVLNDPAFEQFEEGEEYWVTFTKAPKPQPGDGHEIRPVENKQNWMVCEVCGHTLGPSQTWMDKNPYRKDVVGPGPTEEAKASHAEIYGVKSDEPVA